MNALIRAEAIKLRTLRSTWAMLLLLIVLSAGLISLVGALSGTHGNPALGPDDLRDLLAEDVGLRVAAVGPHHDVRGADARDPRRALAAGRRADRDPVRIDHGQRRAAGQPGAGAQQAITKIMPLFIGFISWNFPAGLIIYWATGNLFRLGQQALIFKMDGRPTPAATTTEEPKKEPKAIPASEQAEAKKPQQGAADKRRRRRRR